MLRSRLRWAAALVLVPAEGTPDTSQISYAATLKEFVPNYAAIFAKEKIILFWTWASNERGAVFVSPNN